MTTTTITDATIYVWEQVFAARDRYEIPEDRFVMISAEPPHTLGRLHDWQFNSLGSFASERDARAWVATYVAGRNYSEEPTSALIATFRVMAA